MDRSLFGAARRQPVLLLLAATAMFVALMAVQAQAQGTAPSTVTLCANPSGQLSLGGESGCTGNTTELNLATAETTNELETQLAAAENRITDLEETLKGVTRDSDTLTFSGMNVQVVNGTGSTDGDPTGTGNLIIGYDTGEHADTGPKTGSHYLVVGDEHSYTRFGGIVAGRNNTVTGDWASVTAGQYNTASSKFASVSGGSSNTASDISASVSGGLWNIAGTTDEDPSCNEFGGMNASVSGGSFNIACEDSASVSGGWSNTASGLGSSILGGKGVEASGGFTTSP